MSETPKDSIGRGVGLAFLLHLVGLGCSTALLALFSRGDQYAGLSALVFAMCFGWTQALYMIPAIIVLSVKKRYATLKGLLIIVGIGFLITSGCIGLVRFGF